MPLPNTRVIPPGWSAHHRPTATIAMTATCVITRATGQGTTGPDGTYTPAASTTVHEGPCRVVPRATDQGVHRTIGEDQVTPRRYEISIGYDAPKIHLGDIVTFTDAQDSGLLSLNLRVIDVAFSSEQWQRMLYAQDLQEDSA